MSNVKEATLGYSLCNNQTLIRKENITMAQEIIGATLESDLGKVLLIGTLVSGTVIITTAIIKDKNIKAKFGPVEFDID